MGERELRAGRPEKKRRNAGVRDWHEWTIIRGLCEQTRRSKKIHISKVLMKEIKMQKGKKYEKSILVSPFPRSGSKFRNLMWSGLSI